jgi:hypothetical protein
MFLLREFYAYVPNCLPKFAICFSIYMLQLTIDLVSLRLFERHIQFPCVCLKGVWYMFFLFGGLSIKVHVRAVHVLQVLGVCVTWYISRCTHG